MLPALWLAGCGAGDDPADEVRREAAELVRPEPGRYESTVDLVDYAVPGASPQDAARLQEQMAALGKQVRAYCLTPAAAEQGFEQVLRDAQDGDCAFDRFEADKHTMHAEMTCKGELPEAVSRVTMEGAGYADRSEMVLEIAQRGATVPGGLVRMTLRIENRRTGPCS